MSAAFRGAALKVQRLLERAASFIVDTQRWDGIFANLTAWKYAQYELCHRFFSRNFLKIFRTAFSKNAAGWTLLISYDYSLKISKTPFNTLTPGGNKRSYILKQTSN